MSYSVEQIQETRQSFGSYRYRILKNGEEFAIFWHSYRGECEGIKIVATGYEEDPPFGMCSSLLAGGGPLPLKLSDTAHAYLEKLSQMDKKEAQQDGGGQPATRPESK